MNGFIEIWSYLTRDPLIWLTATLLSFLFGTTLFRLSGRNPWANPVILSVAPLALVLWTTGTPYATYFDGAQFVHFLLGPATVALALPILDNLPHVRRALLPILAALFAGSLVAVFSALGLAWSFGITGETFISLAPKSATAPVALGVSEALGGSPTLTVVMVLFTGMVGAVTVTPLMNLMRIRDWRARGFAAGVAAHGIGTARAFQVHPTAGAFAGLGMGMNAMLTAVLAPAVLRLFL